jgi:TonB family protein
VKLDQHKSKIFLKNASSNASSSHLASGDPWKAPTVAPAPAAAPPKASASAPSQSKMSAREMETKKALREAQSLKDALGGLKSMGLKGVTSPIGKKSSGSKSTGVFDGPQNGSGGAVALNTDVKPLLSGSQVEVHGIGGKGVGGRGSATSGVGYAESGVHGPVSGQGGSFVSMGEGGYKADEGLTKEEVGAVIHGHMGEVRYCHEAAMLQNPRTEGRLVIQFKIDPKGRVESASTDYSTIPAGTLEECVRSRLMTWMFPKPRGGVHVTVSYPFNFKVLERE